MIVIYSQDETSIYNDADSAKPTILDLYGKKFGIEAYEAIKNQQPGYTFRKNGGPLIKTVTSDEADWIKTRETNIGMMT